MIAGHAGRVALAGGVLTLATGLLTACGPRPAGSGGLVGRMTGTSDVAGVPDGYPMGGGGLAIVPIAVMDSWGEAGFHIAVME